MITIQAEKRQTIGGQPEPYKIHAFRNPAGQIIGTYTSINKTLFLPLKEGVRILYPCGTVREIYNSRYEDDRNEILTTMLND